jgi:hypothetical protein
LYIHSVNAAARIIVVAAKAEPEIRLHRGQDDHELADEATGAAGSRWPAANTMVSAANSAWFTTPP